MSANSPACEVQTAAEQRVKAMLAHVLPFGKHKGQALGTIPLGYLCWVLREVKLSSGLRAAVSGEVERRGQAPPPAPPPAPLRPCDRCGSPDVVCSWGEDSSGRRRLWRDCARCGGRRGFAPHVP